MKLKDYFLDIKFNDVVNYTSEYYGTDKESIKKFYSRTFSAIFRYIYVIELELVKYSDNHDDFSIEVDKFEDEDYIDVIGSKSDDNIRYSLSLTSWIEWLDMPVNVNEDLDLKDYEVLSHILYEMTWHGFEDDMFEIKEALEERIDHIESDNVELLDLEELDL